MKNEPLTIEELKEMAGQPVWCPDEEAYGVIMCDSIGKWAGIPFMHGVWYHDGIGAEFNHNIIERKLKCYRVISEKAETNMPTAYDVDAVVACMSIQMDMLANLIYAFTWKTVMMTSVILILPIKHWKSILRELIKLNIEIFAG